MDEDLDFFSDGPISARDIFLSQCLRSGLPVTAYPANQQEGGIPLSCDVVRLGAPSASSIVAFCTGAGGSAGLLNAALCSSFLGERMQRLIGRDVAVLLIHAVNPGGPVWPPRTRQAGPTMIDGDEAAAGQASWTDQLLKAADTRYSAYLRDTMEDPFVASTGSNGAAWSLSVLSQIADDFLRSEAMVESGGGRGQDRGRDRHLLCVDFRTGPGPSGVPVLAGLNPVTGHTRQRIRRWFPTLLEEETTAHIETLPSGGLAELVPDIDHTSLIIEFGTFSDPGLLDAVDARHARASTYPQDKAWRSTVKDAARTLMQDAIKGAEEMAQMLRSH